MNQILEFDVLYNEKKISMILKQVLFNDFDLMLLSEKIEKNFIESKKKKF